MTDEINIRDEIKNRLILEMLAAIEIYMQDNWVIKQWELYVDCVRPYSRKRNIAQINCTALYKKGDGCGFASLHRESRIRYDQVSRNFVYVFSHVHRCSGI